MATGVSRNDCRAILLYGQLLSHKHNIEPVINIDFNRPLRLCLIVNAVHVK